MPTATTFIATPNQVNGGRRGRRARNRNIVAIDGTPTPVPSSESNVPLTQETSRRNRRRRGPRNKLTAYTTLTGIPNSTRSGLTPNPADPRSLDRYRVLGNTPTGAAWALKVLHPCGEHDNNVCKIPDGAASESVIMERRDEFNVVVPADFPADANDWTVVLIQHPYLTQSLLAICGEPADMTDANIQSMYRFSYQRPDRIPSSPAWFSGDTVLNVPLYSSFCEMAVLDGRTTVLAADDYFQGFFKTIRRTYCGLTLDFNGNTLTDSGRITSGQFQDVIDIRAIPSSDTDPPTTIPVYQVQTQAVVDADIVQEDLLNRQAEAKTGEYSPQRMWQPVIDFVPSTAARPVHVEDAADTDPALSDDRAKTIWFSGWGVYISRWESINVTTSIRIKRIEGLEMVVGRGSPYGPFNTPGLPEDLLAKSLAKEFSRTEPHAYEADYNSKNLMGKGLISGIGNALGNLGIPLVSDLAPLLGNLLGNLLPI